MTRGLLAAPLGLLIGLSLGALGSGGSILAVPVLVYAAGQTPQEATAASLLLVGAAAATGLWTHARAGRVRFGTGVVFGLAGLGGSIVGTAVNRRIDGDVLLLAFSGLILLAAWRMVTACPSCTRAGEARELATAPSAAPRPWTPGTSLLVVAINSAIALLARLGSARIDWILAGAFTAAAVAGVHVGARLAGRLEPERSLRAFAAGLVLLALYSAARALTALI